MSVEITIVIPNWNGKDLLRVCLPTLERQTFRNFEIIVVDNASRDGSARMLADEFPEVRVFEMPRNLGFGKAVNHGVTQARAPHIMLLNNDTEVDPRCLERLLDRLSSESPRCGGVQCRMMNYYEREMVDSLGIRLRNGYFFDIGHQEPLTEDHLKPGRVLGLCGGAALFRQEFFDEVGLFDERFFAGYEDVEIALRGLRQGWYYVYEPEAVVFHLKSVTLDKLAHRKRVELMKNFYILAFLHFPGQERPRLLRRLMTRIRKDLFRIVAHIFRRRLVYVLGMYGAIFKNLFLLRRAREIRTVSDDEIAAILSKSEEEGVWEPASNR